MRTKRQSLIKRLDDLTRNQIKLRDNFVCQFSGKSIADGYTVIDWAHIIPRGVGGLLLRWHLANSLCLEHNQHKYFDEHPGEKEAWFKDKFPDRWKLISELRKHKIKTIRTSDLEELLELVKQEARKR